MRSPWASGFVAVCLGVSACMAATQDPSREDLEKQQGTWVAVVSVRRLEEASKDIVRTITRTVEGAHVVWKRGGKNFAGTTLELDPRQTPKR